MCFLAASVTLYTLTCKSSRAGGSPSVVGSRRSMGLLTGSPYSISKGLKPVEDYLVEFKANSTKGSESTQLLPVSYNVALRAASILLW